MEDNPLALILEDEKICQRSLLVELEPMGIRCRVAETVNEAIQAYLEIEKEGLSLDLVFVDLYLRDESKGLEFLQIAEENKWLTRTLVIVTSGNNDIGVLKECYKFKIHNYLEKPISKQVFQAEKQKILKFLEEHKCPVPGYKIIKQIGSGGFAVVYLVRHIQTKQYYAMKEIVKESGNEAELLASVDSPYVIRLHERNTINNKQYLIMEYANHGTLSTLIKQKIKENSSFGIEEIISWIAQLFMGLYTLHESGIIHRDIKSENLFLFNNNMLKIGDLGVARASSNAQTVVGTVSYMAPEMRNLKMYTFALDVWSAGVVLYELIMLKKPFEGENPEDIQNKILKGFSENLPENTDLRLLRLLRLTLAIHQRRASAKEILSLPFIYPFVQTFLGQIRDPKLRARFLKIVPLRFSETFRFESALTQENYLFYLTLAARIDIVVDKVDIVDMPYVFLYIYPCKALPESLYEYMQNNCQVPKETIDLLIELNLLRAFKSNWKKDKTFYRVELFEDPSIMNSIKIPKDGQVLPFDFPSDPMEYIHECLKQIESLSNSIQVNWIPDSAPYFQHVLFSEAYIKFLVFITRLKSLDVFALPKQTKRAFIFTLTEVMIMHETFLEQLRIVKRDDNRLLVILNDLLSAYYGTFHKAEVSYMVSGLKVSTWEMKHLVIRRNKRAPGYLLKPGFMSDPRLKFLDDDDWKSYSGLEKLAILAVCLDTVIFGNESKTIITLSPTYFTPDNFRNELILYFKKYAKDYVVFKGMRMCLPKWMKVYIADTGLTEKEMLGELLGIIGINDNEKDIVLRKIQLNNIKVEYYSEVISEG